MIKKEKKTFIFLTNNFALTSEVIADLYKERWKIELFFKWIKQHLRIKSFYGTSENAIKTQIWTAITVYTLISIIKKKFRIKDSIYKILQILSINIFSKSHINQLLNFETNSNKTIYDSNQLILF